MAKFCGKCGSKLDESTGLCPKCDVEQLKKLSTISVDEGEKQETDIKPEKLLSKKEAKKQKKANKKADKREKKKEKRASWSMGKKIRHFFLKFVLIVLLLGVLAVGVIGVLVHFDLIDVPSLSALREDNLLGIINEKCIDVKEKDIVMESDTKGTAVVIVQMPDYEVLFKKASTSENPEQYLMKALALGKYETQEYEEVATVTVEDGVTMVHSDEVVHKLLEEALINAINDLSEVE